MPLRAPVSRAHPPTRRRFVTATDDRLLPRPRGLPDVVVEGMIGTVRHESDGEVVVDFAGVGHPISLPREGVTDVAGVPALDEARALASERVARWQAAHGWIGLVHRGARTFGEPHARAQLRLAIAKTPPETEDIADWLDGFLGHPEGDAAAALSTAVRMARGAALDDVLAGILTFLDATEPPPLDGPLTLIAAAASAHAMIEPDAVEPPAEVAPSPMDAARLDAERALRDTLVDRYGLEALLQHFEGVGGVRSIHDALLSTQLRLTALLAPRLWGLLEDVRHTLGFNEPVQLFVRGDAELNAFALHAAGPGQPHVVSLTSGLVEATSDQELRFVLGHELGHLRFRHYRMGLVRQILVDDAGQSTMPALLGRRLDTWDRLAELSADRAGFLACGGSLETAVSVFFRLTAGLGPQHLRFDVGAFLEQLDDLARMRRSDVLATFSHPATPVRVQALRLFAAAGLDAPPDARAARDAAVSKLAQLMDLQAVTPQEEHARDFLLAASRLLGAADGGEPRPGVHVLRVELLLPLLADPEDALARLSTRDAEVRLLDAAAWLREHAGEERFDLFSALCHLAAADGEVSAAERGLLHQIAALLDIPERAAGDALFAASREYLHAAGARKRS
jgi:uncharacterized tellurite resistance protein B-like protein